MMTLPYTSYKISPIIISPVTSRGNIWIVLDIIKGGNQFGQIHSLIHSGKTQYTDKRRKTDGHNHLVPGVKLVRAAHSVKIKKGFTVSWLESWAGWQWIISISIVVSPCRWAAEIFMVPPLFPLWSRWVCLSLAVTLSSAYHSIHFSSSNKLSLKKQWLLRTPKSSGDSPHVAGITAQI